MGPTSYRFAAFSLHVNWPWHSNDWPKTYSMHFLIRGNLSSSIFLSNNLPFYEQFFQNLNSVPHWMYDGRYPIYGNQWWCFSILTNDFNKSRKYHIQSWISIGRINFGNAIYWFGYVRFADPNLNYGNLTLIEPQSRWGLSSGLATCNHVDLLIYIAHIRFSIFGSPKFNLKDPTFGFLYMKR